MNKLIILRHGESIWNLENRFTGWTDVPLTKKGIQEASNSGKLIKEERIAIDIVFTSFLDRAINTMKLCLKEIGSKNSPIFLSLYGVNIPLNLQLNDHLVFFSIFTIFPCGKF